MKGHLEIASRRTFKVLLTIIILDEDNYHNKDVTPAVFIPRLCSSRTVVVDRVPS